MPKIWRSVGPRMAQTALALLLLAWLMPGAARASDTSPEQQHASQGSGSAPFVEPPPAPRPGADVASRSARRRRDNSGVMAMRGAAYVMLGTGGESEFDIEGPGGQRDADMVGSFGLGGYFEYPLHRNFTIGGGPSLAWVNDEHYDDQDAARSVQLDVNAFGKLRYPLPGADAEIFVLVPLGFSALFWDDDADDVVSVDARIPGSEQTNAIGLSYGFMAGAQKFFDGGVGIFGQLGWIQHSLGFAVEAPGFTSVDIDYSYGQFSIQAGAVMTL